MTAGLQSCTQPLSVAYDTALLDLDGVVYVGEAPVPRAAPAVEQARANGMSVAFVTNNASRTPDVIAAHLTRLGVGATAEEVVTSSMAAAELLTTVVPPEATVLVVGGVGLHTAIRERGFVDVEVDGDEVAAVVQGYGPEVSWRLLAEATLAVRREVPWIATNLDATLPSPRGLLPGNGALVGAVTTATGRTPVSAGKPELPLHQEAVRRSGATKPLVVGDRLDTDIEGAVRANCDSLLVLTGVTDVAQLWAATPDKRPTYVARDLDGLNESHPAVDVSGSIATCGPWRAERDGAGITVHGKGQPSSYIDALRVVTALAWSDTTTSIGVRGDVDLLRAFPSS